MAIEFKGFLKAIRADGARIRPASKQPVCYDVSLSSAAAVEPTNEEPRPLGTPSQHKHATSRTVAFYCILSAVICAVALCIVLRIYRLDLHVPFTYWGDALYFDAWVKGLMQGHLPWHHPRLGAPFGADWRDFPINLSIEAVIVRFLAIFTSSPGLVLNLLWLFGTVACAGFAAYGLRRLGVERWFAAALGVLYALQPFAFYRGVAHLNLLFYLVPLLATGAIEIAAGRLPGSRNYDCVPRSGWLRLTSSLPMVPAYIYLACLAQGFSYIYNAFFGVVLFAVAALLAFTAYRRRSALITGALLIGITCGATFINLTPSFVYWSEHGRNPAMAYKTPVDAETYGLKLRHLLTPIPNNPFPPLRYVQKNLDNAGFTGENENAMSKLGTVGSVGLLFLLAAALLLCLSTPFRIDHGAGVLGACSALTLTCLLLATVGGFGALFNVFVAPDIRAYDRIVVFIDFFAITAVGLLLTRLSVWFHSRNWPALVPLSAFVLLVFGVADQAVTAIYRDSASRESEFHIDDAFVRTLESVLPRNASIFQLPFTDFPAEGPPFHMREYDQSRPYLHSDALRWTWGGVSGRQAGEWARQTSSLPVKDMVGHLARAGFSGIWIDRFGYAPGTSPEREIAAVLGNQPLQRRDGRIAFYDLRAYTKQLRTALPGNVSPAEQRVEITFLKGFFGEERNDKQTWRWCSQHDVMLIHNSLPQPRTVKLMATLQTNGAEEFLTISVGGRAERIKVVGQRVYTRKLQLPPEGSAIVSFDCEGTPINAPGDPRIVYFGLINPRVVE